MLSDVYKYTNIYIDLFDFQYVSYFKISDWLMTVGHHTLYQITLFFLITSQLFIIAHHIQTRNVANLQFHAISS